MSAVAMRAVLSPTWGESITAAVVSVAATALRMSVEVGQAVDLPHVPGLSAYIPVIASTESLQVGLLTTEAGAATLARALLQMGPTDDLSHADIADAMGEVANMVVGMGKAAMASQIGLVALGLPMVIHGWVEPNEHTEVEALGVRVGDVPLTIVLQHAPRPS